MPHARLPLPDYPWTSAYRALVDVLEHDPDLKRVGVTFRSWKGGPEDIEPLGPGHLPWFELTPGPTPIRPATEQDYQADFQVRVRFAVPGTRVDDLMNLWGAAMQALRFDAPFRDTTVGLHFREVGENVIHGVAGVGIDPKFTAENDFQADAVIVMKLFLPS